MSHLESFTMGGPGFRRGPGWPRTNGNRHSQERPIRTGSLGLTMERQRQPTATDIYVPDTNR